MALPVHDRHPNRLERLVARDDLVSTHAVARVSRFDGRTHVIAVRTTDGWQRRRRVRWTPETVDHLRGSVREVLLSRNLRHARVPLSWIPLEKER